MELARNLGIRTLTLPIADIMSDLRRRAGATRFSGRAAGRHRREHPVAHPRQSADGALQQVRLAAAHHRQQIGDVGGILHALRRHERRPGGDRGSSENDGLPRFALAQPRKPDIPEAILTKAPSAELRPDQTDQDSLPPYDLLDQILELHIEQCQSAEEIIAQGFDEATVRRVLRLVRMAEFKRKQAAPVLKVTSRAFGTGWRMPIVRQE